MLYHSVYCTSRKANFFDLLPRRQAETGADDWHSSALASACVQTFLLPHQCLKLGTIELFSLHQGIGQALELVKMLLQDAAGHLMAFVEDLLDLAIDQGGQARAARGAGNWHSLGKCVLPREIRLTVWHQPATGIQRQCLRTRLEVR